MNKHMYADKICSLPSCKRQRSAFRDTMRDYHGFLGMISEEFQVWMKDEADHKKKEKEWEKQRHDLDEQISSLKKAYRDRERDKKTNSCESRISEDLKKFKKKTKKLEEEIEELSADNRHLMAKNKENDIKIEQNESQLKELTKTKELLLLDKNNNEERITSLREEVGTFNKEYNDLDEKYNNLEQKHKDLVKKCEDLERNQQLPSDPRINRKPAEKTIENEILKNKIKELEDTLEDMKAKENENLHEQQNIAEHLKTLKAQNLQKVNDLELTINEKEKQLYELSENYKVNAEQLHKNYDSVRSKMGIKNQEIAKLTEKNHTLERMMETERSEFKQKQEEFKTKILENEEKLVFEKKEAQRKAQKTVELITTGMQKTMEEYRQEITQKNEELLQKKCKMDDNIKLITQQMQSNSIKPCENCPKQQKKINELTEDNSNLFKAIDILQRPSISDTWRNNQQRLNSNDDTDIRSSEERNGEPNTGSQKRGIKQEPRESDETLNKRFRRD